MMNFYKSLIFILLSMGWSQIAQAVDIKKNGYFQTAFINYEDFADFESSSKGAWITYSIDSNGGAYVYIVATSDKGDSLNSQFYFDDINSNAFETLVSFVGTKYIIYANEEQEAAFQQRVSELDVLSDEVRSALTFELNVKKKGYKPHSSFSANFSLDIQKVNKSLNTLSKPGKANQFWIAEFDYEVASIRKSQKNDSRANHVHFEHIQFVSTRTPSDWHHYTSSNINGMVPVEEFLDYRELERIKNNKYFQVPSSHVHIKTNQCSTSKLQNYLINLNKLGKANHDQVATIVSQYSYYRNNPSDQKACNQDFFNVTYR